MLCTRKKPNECVLGVIFDSKVQWSAQGSNVIKKAKGALLMKTIFYIIRTKAVNYFKLLLNLTLNAEIWHIPTLNTYSKRQLLSASSMALKICMFKDTSRIFYNRLHKMNQRATTKQHLLYKPP